MTFKDEKDEENARKDSLDKIKYTCSKLFNFKNTLVKFIKCLKDNEILVKYFSPNFRFQADSLIDDSIEFYKSKAKATFKKLETKEDKVSLYWKLFEEAMEKATFELENKTSILENNVKINNANKISLLEEDLENNKVSNELNLKEEPENKEKKNKKQFKPLEKIFESNKIDKYLSVTNSNAVNIKSLSENPLVLIKEDEDLLNDKDILPNNQEKEIKKEKRSKEEIEISKKAKEAKKLEKINKNKKKGKIINEKSSC